MTLYPREERHSVFTRYNQDLTDALKIDVQAFYTDLKTELNNGAYSPGSGATVSSLNPDLTPNINTAPFFGPHQIGTETSQQVFFQFGNRDANSQLLSLKTWGITPTLTADLGHSWQLRVLGSYGESTTENHADIFNTTALPNAINAGLFNPYDPASSNAAAVAAITNYETFGLARQSMKNVRAVVDGDLFTLPGGAIKLAAGFEYTGEAWKSQAGDQVPGTEDTGYAGLSLNSAVGGVATSIIPASGPLRHVDLSRNVKSAFAEVVVPIFGASNAMTGLQELSLSAAGRYDKYSDVGDTTNPKFGVTYKPVKWLKLRGAWGKSFNAPSLADAPEADITTLFEISPFLAANVLGVYPTGSNLQANGGRYPAPTAGQYVFVVRGNSDKIVPQTAKTTSFGFDF
jgi:iron complex outermembrane receptor protein